MTQRLPALIALAFALSACGGGEDSPSGEPGSTAAPTAPEGAGDAAGDAPDAPVASDPAMSPPGPAPSSTAEVAGAGAGGRTSGIREHGPESIGVCVAEGRRCGTYLGRDVVLSEPGKYLLWAELEVPKEGEGWAVSATVECTITAVTAGGTSTAQRSSTKEYKVQYGGTQHGYRLGLWGILSPNPGGTRDCSWSLTALHPDGQGDRWSGTWKLPASS